MSDTESMDAVPARPPGLKALPHMDPALMRALMTDPEADIPGDLGGELESITVDVAADGFGLRAFVVGETQPDESYAARSPEGAAYVVRRWLAGRMVSPRYRWM